MDYIKLLLMLVSAIAWTLVYINCIRIGFKQKTYCIPLWALSLNFTWEVWHGIFDLHELGPQLQVSINVLWALFDSIILYTFFRSWASITQSILASKWPEVLRWRIKDYQVTLLQLTIQDDAHRL